MGTSSEVHKAAVLSALLLKTCKNTNSKRVWTDRERMCVVWCLTESTDEERHGNWMTHHFKKWVAFRAALSRESAMHTLRSVWRGLWGCLDLLFLPLTQHCTQFICPCPAVGRTLKKNLILPRWEELSPWGVRHTNCKIKPSFSALKPKLIQQDLAMSYGGK